MRRRTRARTLFSAGLILFGLGTIAFSGVRTVVDQRLFDTAAEQTAPDRPAVERPTSETWRWILAGAALATGIALMDTRRPT